MASDLSFGDFTNFLSQKNVMLLSDTEGYMPIGILNKLRVHIEDKVNNAAIFNGDVADYTSGKLAIDYTKPGRFAFLKIVKAVNDNENFKSTLGNRDVNKLVVWQLVQRKDKKKMVDT